MFSLWISVSLIFKVLVKILKLISKNDIRRSDFGNSLGGFDFECFYQKKTYLRKTYISKLKKISTLGQKRFIWAQFFSFKKLRN
jgi:hypothetical protein